MGVPDNIQNFNDIASQVFNILYEEFPAPASLAPEHFDITTDLDGSPTWRGEDFEPIENVISLLAEEGYLRIEGASYSGFYGVVLTRQGLMALKSIPDVISEKEPLGDQLKKAVKDGSKKVAWKVVDQIIAYGFKQLHGLP